MPIQHKHDFIVNLSILDMMGNSVHFNICPCVQPPPPTSHLLTLSYKKALIMNNPHKSEAASRKGTTTGFLKLETNHILYLHETLSCYFLNLSLLKKKN